MSFGVERSPRSASVRSAFLRSSAERCTSTRGADVVGLVMGASSLWGLCVRREAYASEQPPAAGREEVAIRGADVGCRGDARTTAQHHLRAHELAVVFTDGAGRGAEARIRQIRARRPLPYVTEGLH